MKHKTLKEWQGMPLSQGARIGVIEIAPDDDRKAVLTAILAEERLKREKIVLDLPKQNKAFQRPEDFDDLKMLRRKLQAELIFVTPPGPGPSDFARQRRFAVFSSIDSFVRSFTTGSTSQSDQSRPAPSQPNKQGRKGFLGGVKKAAPTAAAGAAAFVAGEAVGKVETAGTPPLQRRRSGQMAASEARPASDVPDQPTQPVPPKPARPLQPAPQTPLPQTEEDEDQDPGLLPASLVAANTLDLHDDQNASDIHDAGSAGAAGTGAGPFAADAVRQRASTGQDVSPDPNIDKDEDWDALPPVPGQPIPSNLPNTPAVTGTGAPRRKTPSTPLRTPPSSSGPDIIDLRPPRGALPRGTEKKTKILPPSAIEDTATQAPPPPTPVTTPPSKPSGNTGKVAAAGAAGAVAGAMAADALTSNTTSTGQAPAAPARPTTNTGKTPAAPRGNASTARSRPPAASNTTINTGWPPPSGPMSPRRTPSPKRKGRALLIAALVILLLLAICAATTLANIGGVRDRIGSIVTPPPPATVTITPPSKPVQDTYVMSGINGNTNIDNRQISVHQLSSTQTVTKSVQLTHVHIEPQSATGTITFFNGSGAVLTVPKGITFNVGNVQIVTDAIAVIPAAKPPTEGQITVPAHAVQPGTAGNVAASAINGFCCDTAARISAKNQNAFIGGADLVDYNYLKPEDVTKVTNDNQGALKSSAQDDITKNKKTAGEQFLGDIKCDDPKTTADPQPNAHVESKNNTAATVTVSVTCSAQVYDNNAAKTIAQNLLKQKVSKDPALGGYVLADKNIATQIQPQQVQQNGDPTFSANAQGTAYYQWNDAMKQALLNKIKGMSVKDAQAALSNYPGVANAKIDISNGGSALPNDVNQIDVKFNNPSASSIPTPTGSTPTN